MTQTGGRELIGWTRSGRNDIFHRVRTKTADDTGVSRCGANLVSIAPRIAARPHERECADCQRPAVPPTAKAPRPRPAPASAATTIEPEHIRVTPDNGLIVRQLGGTAWFLIDVETGSMSEVDEALAVTYPTLRSRMPLVDLIAVGDLASEFQISVAGVSKLRARHEDFPPPNVRLGGRPGWYPERLRELLDWERARGGRSGGGRPPTVGAELAG